MKQLDKVIDNMKDHQMKRAELLGYHVVLILAADVYEKALPELKTKKKVKWYKGCIVEASDEVARGQVYVTTRE